MAIYSIKDLEKLSGIKAHTIRVWEQRYRIVTPKRTNTNIRYYHDEDLKAILNIALLNRNGYRISKIAQMTHEEIAQKVASISEANFEHSIQLDALTISMIEMDEYKFDRIISTNIQQLGFEQTVLRVIYPFLDKLSVLWLTSAITPIQENFITYLIRQKIIAAIDREPMRAGQAAPKFMIFLPAGESMELSLLLMHYLLKSRRNRVIYLGLNVSLQDLEDACRIHQPDYLYTMINEPFDHIPVREYVNKLSTTFVDCQLLLSGYQVVSQRINDAANVKIVESLDATIKYVDSLHPNARSDSN